MARRDTHGGGGGRARASDEAAALNERWNAGVRYGAPPAAGLDPELQSTIERITALGATPAPRRAFTSRLEEELMENRVMLSWPKSGFAAPWRQHLAIPTDRRSGRMWAASASIAITAAVALLIAFVGPSLFGADGQRPTVIPAAFSSDPTATAIESTNTDWLSHCDAIPHDECLGSGLSDGSGYITFDFLDPNDRGSAAPAVQLQDWTVEPGAKLPGTTSSAAVGEVVDFVTEGAYAATFRVPVVVNRGIPVLARQAFDPGTTIELVRGDSVTYPLGGLSEIRNPLFEQRLAFKRAVIYEGDISGLSEVSAGISTSVDGDVTLPVGVAAPGGMSIAIWFVWYDPSVFPASGWEYARIVGPVIPNQNKDVPDVRRFVLLMGGGQG
jgi:hypothetical protein